MPTAQNQSKEHKEKEKEHKIKAKERKIKQHQAAATILTTLEGNIKRSENIGMRHLH